MVDYDEAERAVQDPNADPAFLARIAYENPTFDALVANHRRAYPGLLAWIAQFGTPEARRVLRMRTDLPEAVTRYLQEPDITPDNGSAADQDEQKQSKQSDQSANDSDQSAIEEQLASSLNANQSESSDQSQDQSVDTPLATEAQSTSDNLDSADLNSSPFVQTNLQPDAPAAQPVQSTETSDAHETPAQDQQPVESNQESANTNQQQSEQSPVQQPAQHDSSQSPTQSVTSAAATTPATAAPAQPVQPAGPALKLSPLAQQLLAETGLEADTQVHGHTPAEAMDAQTPWMAQHDIAVQAPELLPFLALNSNIYPELKSWLGNLGDPLINQALSGNAA
jgi:hypothetical protein